MHLREGKVLHPVLQVERIDADPQRTPGCVDQTQRPVLESKNLKGGDLWLFGQSLRIVRNGSSHWVTDDYDQFDVLSHRVDALGGAVCNKIARGFLHRDLALQR